MMIKVVGQRVLVLPDPLEEEAAGIKGFTIVRPGEQEKAERAATGTGTVVYISDIAFKDIGNGEPWCAIGDRIIFARHSGKFIDDPDTNEKNKYFMIRDEDVQAVIVKG